MDLQLQLASWTVIYLLVGGCAVAAVGLFILLVSPLGGWFWSWLGRRRGK